MKLTKKTAIITASALVLIVGTGAIAKSGHDRFDHEYDRHGWMFGDFGKHKKMIKYLNRHLDLSDEQEASISEILDDKYMEMKEFRDLQIKEASDLVRGDELAVEDVNAIIDTLINKREEMKHGFSEVIVAIHSVLTPEQRAQVAEMITEGRGYRWRKNKDRS